MYCILFNGPPRSGKDTLASRIDGFLCERTIPSQVQHLSLPMRKVAFVALGLRYDVLTYESIKDQPQDAFKGDTVREFMIKLSESFMIPTYGPTAWVDMFLAPHLESVKRNSHRLLMVPDLGFARETAAFDLMFGPQNVLTVQVHRDGKEWGNDSRGWCSTTNMVTVRGYEDRVDDAAGNVMWFAAHHLGWDLA